MRRAKALSFNGCESLRFEGNALRLVRLTEIRPPSSPPGIGAAVKGSTSFFSFMTITMPPMIDPIFSVLTHSSMEMRSTVQTLTKFEKTAD